MIRKLFFLTAVIAVLAIVGSCILVGRMMPFRTKSMVLKMSWKRGDNHYGPNFISLESPCLGNSQSGCFCSMDFKATTSKDFMEYIQSFGSNKVPVKYRVYYDRNPEVVGAWLESVGTWPGKRFHDNERLLATGFRMITGQASAGATFGILPTAFPNPPIEWDRSAVRRSWYLDSHGIDFGPARMVFLGFRGEN